MSSPRFEVHASARVLADFRAEVVRALPSASWPQAAAALQRCLDILALVPLDFGEERDELPALQLQQRIAFFTPLVVRYSVSESLRAVWLQSIRLYGESE